MDTLFSHISVITMDERMSVLTDAFVGVTDGKITWLSKKEPEEKPKRLIEGAGMVLLPGLINCHTNLEQTILRCCGDDRTPAEYWQERVYPPMEKLDEAGAKASALLGIAECLRFGVTSVSDLGSHANAVAEAAVESGIKANIAPEMTMLLGEDFDFEADPQCCDFVKVVETWHGHDNGRILMEAGLHGESTSSHELWQPLAEFAINTGLGLHLNLSQTKQEQEDCLDASGLSQAQLLDCYHLFDVRTQAAHCNHLEKEDLPLLAKRNVSCVHCPVSGQKLAVGQADVLSLVKSGMNVALGTDSAAAVGSLDLLRQVRATALAAKVKTVDPTTLNAAAALLMATGCGARAQGRAKETGMIKLGMDADLAMLDFNQLHLIPCHDLTASVVYAASGGDVCLTMVRGNILYAAGRYFTIDLPKVMEELTQWVIPAVFDQESEV